MIHCHFVYFVLKYKNNSYFKSYSKFRAEFGVLDPIGICSGKELGVPSSVLEEVCDSEKKENLVLRECIIKKEQEISTLKESNKKLQLKIEQASQEISVLSKQLLELKNCNKLDDNIISAFDSKVPELSFIIAKKMFSGMLGVKYIDIIRSSLNESMSLLKGNLLNIKLEVSPKILASVGKMIKEEYNFNNLEIIPNTDLDICDCRIYWDDGYIENISSDIVNKILRVIK